MDEDIINDLKQFITTTVSQQTSSMGEEIRAEITKLDIKLSSKIDELSDSVADALHSSNEITDDQLKDHEQRIAKLEHKVA